MPLTVQDLQTFVYPKLRYGTTPVITRTFRETGMNYQTPMLAERSENRVASGRTEYLFSRLEETARVDMWCEPDELLQLRWFYEDHGSRGKQFEFWIDRWTGSCWCFEDSLRDQNKLVLVLNTGSAAYADATNGRGIALGAGQYLSVALAQASAGTKTGFDDPLDYREGVVVLDLKPLFAGGDSVLHVLLDTSAAAGGAGIYGSASTFGSWGSGVVNRLQIRKTAANALELEITDGSGIVKIIGGAVTWSVEARVRIVGSWSTAGVLTLSYAVDGGSFTALTTASGTGTGLIAALPTTLYLGADNAGANAARGTYDTVAFFKRAYENPTAKLPIYRPVWRNYFGYAELQRAWQPVKVVPQKSIWAWPFLIRNGVAA